MRSIVLIPILLQLVLPLALVSWVASRRHPSRLSWVLAVVLAAAWIAAVSVAGLWLVLPWYLPIVHGLLLAIAAARSVVSIRDGPGWPRGGRALAGAAATAVAAALAVALTAWGLAGRIPPDRPAVELAPPLRGGTYLVANGGSNALVNPHLSTMGDAPRLVPWRGQSRGLDLVRIDALGRRARTPAPSDPAAYAIFGDTVFAPCSGRIIAAVDGLSDLLVPEIDREHMAGNHVMIGCGRAWVLLAHLRRGSVTVRTEDRVAVGNPVGQVGNTGNTGEPHLHVHAQTPGTGVMPVSGEPLPITIAGRYLARGQRARW